MSKNTSHNWVRLLWNGKIHLLNAVIVMSAVVMTALIFGETVLRYVFNTSLFGANEIASFSAAWLYFAGAAAATERKRNISASLTDFCIKSKAKSLVVQIIADLLAASGAAWIAVWAWQYTIWTLDMNMMSIELDMRMGLIIIIAPIGLSLMSFYLFVDLINHVRELLEEVRP